MHKFKTFMDADGYIYGVSQLKGGKLYCITRTMYRSDITCRWKSESNIPYPTLKEAERNLKRLALKNGWFGFKEECEG